MNRLTVFFKESGNLDLYSAEGEKCISSGFTINELNGAYTLTYSYKNCNIKTVRELKEYELKDWGLGRKR